MSVRNTAIVIVILISVALALWYAGIDREEDTVRNGVGSEKAAVSEYIVNGNVPSDKALFDLSGSMPTQNETGFSEMLRQDDYAGIARLLESRRLSQQDKDNALRKLSGKCQYELVEKLAAGGAAVDRPGEYASTPLMEAVKAGDEAMARLLVKLGAKVDKKSCTDESYLVVAAAKVDARMIRFLLDNGACIDCQCRTDAGDGGTPLYHAAMWGHPEAVEELLNAGADPEIDTEWYFTPLMIAAQNGNAECVRVLLKHGARFSFGDDIPDPVKLARKNGHEDVALLIEGARTK